MLSKLLGGTTLAVNVMAIAIVALGLLIMTGAVFGPLVGPRSGGEPPAAYHILRG